MFEYTMTIGLNDKDSKRQEVTTCDAKNMISETLLHKFDIFAFTMIDCAGVYTHDDGAIVSENSIRVEIASDDCIDDTIGLIIKEKKKVLNQECIMLKKSISDISFE